MEKSQVGLMSSCIYQAELMEIQQNLLTDGHSEEQEWNRADVF